MYETTEGATTHRLWSLQAGRAVASILLVFYHNGCCVFVPKYWSHNPVGNLFSFGFASFNYFFVLSGFTIMSSYSHDFGRPAKIWAYVWKRFARIYPAYWVVLSILVIIYFAFPQLGDGSEREAKMIVSSYSLITYGPMRDAQRPESIMLGAWALYHGILFYIFFGLIILSGRVGLTFMLLWFFASALMLYNLTDASLMSFYLAPIHLLFGIGMGAAVLYRKDSIIFPRAVTFVGVLVFFVAMLDQLWFRGLAFIPRSLLYGVGSAGTILGFAVLERRGSLRVPVVLKFLGDASYSIFLVHFPVLILLTKLTSRFQWHESLPLAVWYFVFAVAAVCAGVLFYLFVERPLLKQIAHAGTTLSDSQRFEE